MGSIAIRLGKWVGTPLIVLLAGSSAFAASVKIESVKFTANTNVKMFKFTGEAKDLSSEIVLATPVGQSPSTLQSLVIHIPVSSLKTGMKIRDDHTRERIFTTDDGKVPDVLYQATHADCTPGKSPTEQNCRIEGQLSIRGEKKDFPLDLVLKNGTDASGTAMIDVLQFGVKPEVLKYTGIVVDPVVRLDFEAKIQ
jgi:polyisoprenoid-binding protein YceI